MCLQLSDESISRKGACGCVNAALDIFGSNNAPMIKVGCFAFGQTCYESNCDDYSYDCRTCAVLASCGYCAASNGQDARCVRGDASGAINGVCPRPQFTFDPRQC